MACAVPDDFHVLVGKTYIVNTITKARGVLGGGSYASIAEDANKNEWSMKNRVQSVIVSTSIASSIMTHVFVI